MAAKNAVAKAWTYNTWGDGTKRSRPIPAVYETYFPTTENPLSEGGIWVNGNLSPAPFGGVQVTAGGAYADHLIGTSYTDSIAYIDPSFRDYGPNHYVEIDIYRDVAYTPPSSHEIQLHLRASGKDTANRPLYEILIPFGGTNGQIMLQSGPIGGWSELTTSGSGWGVAPSTGDTFRAEMIGSNINLYFRPSGGSFGGSVMSVTDTSLTAGQPGFGLYCVSGSGADPTKFRVSRFKCGVL